MVLHAYATVTALPPVAPDGLRRAMRRLGAASRAALFAADQLGLTRIGAARALVVVAAETTPSPELLSAAVDLAGACRAGRGGHFRSDPAFILEMMDSTLLAAVSILARFHGDGIAIGPGSGQLVAAVEACRERTESGRDVVLLAGRAGDGSRAPLGVAAHFYPAAEGVGVRHVRTGPEDHASAADALVAWLAEAAG